MKILRLLPQRKMVMGVIRQILRCNLIMLDEENKISVSFLRENPDVVYGGEQTVGKDKSQPSAKICQVLTDMWLKRGNSGKSSHDNVSNEGISGAGTSENHNCW